MKSSTRIILDPSRPILADCRWNCERRMGVGDKLVVVGALQALQRAGLGLSVSANPADGDLFLAANLPSPDSFTRYQALPMRDHCMAVPIGMTNEETDDFDGNEAIHPVHRVLWGLGLAQYTPPTPAIHLKFYRHPHTRTGTMWMPLEVSRKANAITPEEWAEILSSDAFPAPLRALASVNDLPIVRTIVDAVERILGHRIPIVYTSNLVQWGKALESTSLAITPNSGGLWMALATSTPCICVQRDLPAPHQKMWKARDWWAENLRVVTLPA